MGDEVYLGFDVGSIFLKTVVLDSQARVRFEDCRRANGRPFHAALAVLRQLQSAAPVQAVRGVAATGSGGEKLAEILGGYFVNEIVALSAALPQADPDVRTAIEIGGQDSKLLLFDRKSSDQRPVLSDFAMNSLCAAGAGSFLDQQATRLGLSIEGEFGELALRSADPPRIAGRCSVFAKSDMIHLQQIATPVHDIVAGLCLALARCFMATVGKGKAFHRPIAFLGGVASNAGMVRAFEKILDLEPGQLRIPPRHRALGAIGAVIRLRNGPGQTPFHGSEALEACLSGHAEQARKSHELLRRHLPASTAPVQSVSSAPAFSGEKIEAYVGIDVGSISTNVVVIDRGNRLLAKRYLPTASRPIEAVRRALEEIREQIGDRIEVRAAGSTGSGRHLIGELTGADVIRNEITAQATAAILFDPRVDTVFEIGGQDSKYISIDHGVVRDFEMNRACAAGTGSFLEEQAERLGVDLERDFAPLALDAQQPVWLGDRCTVFMESDLVHHQQRGAAVADLLGGLAYSIVHNYLNRVVGDRRIGSRILFQGGTAFNQAVVAAFRSVTGKDIVVPPHHEVTGAIGAALLAREKTRGPSRFRGFDILRLSHEVKAFTCRSCENLCEIRQVRLDGQKPLHYGGRCERYDVERRGGDADGAPDLFAEREALLREAGQKETAHVPKTKGRVGIPFALALQEALPFWRTFFESLGFEVALSNPTTQSTVHSGVAAVAAETCFPVKVAHGHVLELLDQPLDFLFLPSLIDAGTEDFGPKDRTAFNCPFVQAFPYMSRGAIDFAASRVKVFSPALHMQWGLRHLEKALSRSQGLLKSGRRQIRRALECAEAAQAEFHSALERRGREVLSDLKGGQLGLVVVGRPYNGCDRGANLDVPRKLRGLGVLPIPMDMLPTSQTPLPQRWRQVYWRSGQRILKAAEIIKTHPNLFAVYVTNFGCGPDSFLTQYFREEMADKPYLQLEIDEHSADAGLITRCEAFLDTLQNLPRHGGRRVVETIVRLPRPFSNHRRFYVPNMAPQARALVAGLRSKGADAQVMDASDEESIYWGGRCTSGRECYPCLLTIGDMIRETRRDGFDPERSAFLMPRADGPCRFGQYGCLHRQILDKMGLEQVPIVSLELDNEYQTAFDQFGTDFERRVWLGAVAIDALEKLLLETRPYETTPGTTDAWFWESVHGVCQAVESSPRAFWALLPALFRSHAGIPRTHGAPRPRIGVVGEVYVRANAFANNDLFKTIEALGGEVVVPGVSEIVRYMRYVRVRRNRNRRQLRQIVVDAATDWLMTHEERAIYARFGRKPDPTLQDLFAFAAPYLDVSFQGEAILTIGKSVEMVRHLGVGGIVNTMPFTCMPGTICAALFKRLREDHDNVPILNMIYTGQQTLNNRARLEAFVHQAKEFAASRRA